MTDTFRALCVELAFCWSRTTNPEDFAENAAPIIERARAALAQPEPVGPTDEELMTAYWQGAGLAGAGTGDHILRGIRSVLTRYSRPTITPIPVSERLPYDAELSDEGECWWFHAGAERWDLLPRPPLKLMEWSHWLPAHALPLPNPTTDAP